MGLFNLKKIKVTKRQFTFCILLILLLLGLFLQFEATSDLKNTLRDEETRLEEAKNFETLQKRHNHLKKELDDLEGMLPTEERLSQLLDELTSLAKKNNVRVLSIKPSSWEKVGSYQEIPISMDLESSFYNLGEFLNKLENSTVFLVNIKDLKIKSDPRAKLKVHLVATAFKLIEEKGIAGN